MSSFSGATNDSSASLPDRKRRSVFSVLTFKRSRNGRSPSGVAPSPAQEMSSPFCTFRSRLERLVAGSEEAVGLQRPDVQAIEERPIAFGRGAFAGQVDVVAVLHD